MSQTDPPFENQSRVPLRDWRVAVLLADVSDVLGITSEQVLSQVSQGTLPARVVDGLLLLSYGDLANPERNELTAKVHRAWGEAMERDVMQATRRVFADDYPCDGCGLRRPRSRGCL